MCLLIPFLPIRFRRYIPSDSKIQSVNSPDEQRSLEKKLQKSKEELTSFFSETILILDQEIADGFLSDFEKNLILDLLQKSMFRVSYSNKDLCQEVYNMTEPVLKLRTDEIFEVIHENDALKKALKLERSKRADQDAELAEYKRIYGELKPTSHN